jgi:hypothetical protein
MPIYLPVREIFSLKQTKRPRYITTVAFQLLK